MAWSSFFCFFGFCSLSSSPLGMPGLGLAHLLSCNGSYFDEQIFIWGVKFRSKFLRYLGYIFFSPPPALPLPCAHLGVAGIRQGGAHAGLQQAPRGVGVQVVLHGAGCKVRMRWFDVLARDEQYCSLYSVLRLGDYLEIGGVGLGEQRGACRGTRFLLRGSNFDQYFSKYKTLQGVRF